MVDLSVVIITKNLEWNVARIIESVLDHRPSAMSTEVVVVDSASSDRTVEIAKQYPVHVIRLEPDQRLCAAMGRYVGYNFSNGDFVLFLDGDLELGEGWLEHALSLLESQSDVAAVTGRRIYLTKQGEFTKNQTNVDPSVISEVQFPGSSALFRRSILEQVGTFNPYLISDEEPDLGIRIRHAGYRIKKTSQMMAYHYGEAPDDISTLIRRWRRKLYQGAGQNIRYYLGTEYLPTYMRERGFGLLPALALFAGLASLLLSVGTQQPLWFFGWLLLVVAIFVVDAIRKRSLYRALFSMVRRLMIIDGTVRGFLLSPLNANDYPVKFEIIKRANEH